MCERERVCVCVCVLWLGLGLGLGFLGLGLGSDFFSFGSDGAEMFDFKTLFYDLGS